MEDDLKNINGRNRDYLLEAWYSHTFKGEGWNLTLTGGIIDATAYIDDNEFANDEVSQFMNDVFVNNPLASLPSYDLGGVVEFNAGNVSLKGLVMNSKTDDGDNYNYYSLQAGYSLETSFGTGNYRVYYWRTTKAFPASGEGKNYLEGVGLSLDQKLGKRFGVFGRLGFNTHTSTGDLKAFYSGGLVVEKLPLKGQLGTGLAYSDGNKKVSGLKDATTAEVYYKIPVWKRAELTFDLQWDKEIFEGQKLEATTYGVRFSVAF